MLAPDEAIHHALRLLTNGRHCVAEAVLAHALAMQPDSADALHLLGTCAGQKALTERAVTLMGRALAMAPKSTVIRRNLAVALTLSGIAHHAAGRFEEAAPTLRHALALDPEDVRKWSYTNGLKH